jgi:Glyoxalase/Bleomycin resistance protein/Dioxygenase superfamily
MINPNLDHVGIVVPDLEPALEALAQHLGVEWMGTFERVLTVNDAQHGTRDIVFNIGLTAQYPRLEVIQAIPDSPWALAGDGMVLHHLGYNAADLAADSSAVAGPCPIEICGVGTNGESPKTFTYHVHDGLRFELLEPRTPEGTVTR